jgi:peptidoglycan hydrolase-like protein with peptidoglycan-binding domain
MGAMPARNRERATARARRAIRRRLVTAVVAAVALGAVVTACSGDDTISGDAAPSTTASGDTTAPPSTRPPATTSSTSTTSTTTTTTTIGPPPVPVADLRLQKGDEGDAVRALEADLLAKGYWLDRADDGVFDESTRHAVVALQKTYGLERTGVVDLATVSALAQIAPPPARSTTGTVIEVDLTRQVLFVVRDGLVSEIFDVSTGKRAGTTPVGEYAVTREIDGIRNAPLGRLYRPKYFVGGVAVHGYSKVPPQPASHGCVRVTNAVMDHIWDAGLMPKGTPVWVYS